MKIDVKRGPVAIIHALELLDIVAIPGMWHRGDGPVYL